jgi:hypothetical protein
MKLLFSNAVQFFLSSQLSMNSSNLQLDLDENIHYSQPHLMTFHFYSPPSCSNCQNCITLRYHSLDLLPLLLEKNGTPRTQPVSSDWGWAALSFLHTSKREHFEVFLSFPTNIPKHGPSMAQTNSLPYRTYQNYLQVSVCQYSLVSTCLRNAKMTQKCP